MSGLWADLRQGWRANLKRWPSSLVIVLLLGCGIGATVALFNMQSTMTWRPLPFEDPNTLVALRETQPHQGRYGAAVAWPTFLDWQRENRVFSALGAYQRSSFNVGGGGQDEPEALGGTRITPSLFPLLGATPLLGRGFSDAEGRPGQQRVVLISHAVWERRLASDPQIVGRTLRIDGEPHSIVGVMPPPFAFPEDAELWVPLVVDEAGARRDVRAYEVIARLREGISVAEAQAQLSPLAAEAARLHPATNAGWGVSVVTLKEDLLPSEAIAGSNLSAGAVFLVLVITCANVALLLLARFQSRGKETAVRLALGATRWDLTRQLLTECLLLAVAGGLIGIPLCFLATHLTVAFIPTRPPYWLSFDIQPSTFVLGAAITLAAALMAGLLPALRSSRVMLAESLKEETRSTTGGRRTGRLRQAFATAQFALSFVLLVSALLVSVSFQRLQRFDRGFEASQVLTLQYSLYGERYQDGGLRLRLGREILREAQALPGVEHTALSTNLPLRGMVDVGVRVVTQERPVQPGEEDVTQWRAVSSDYFATFRIPLLRGRGFTSAEEENGAHVALVSATLARQLWPNEEALGRRLRLLDAPPGEWWEVVGVTGTVKRAYRMGGMGHIADSQLYVPLSFTPGRSYWLSLRSAHDWRSAPIAAVKGLLARADRGIPPFDLASMEAVVREAEWVPLLWLRLFVAYSVLALVLTSLGTYGLVSHAVQLRTQELGVRMALGAHAGIVSRLILRQALTLAARGVVCGLLVAVGLAPLLRVLLQGVSPLYPPVIVGATLVMALVSVIAAGLPAWRAGRIDPVVALRCE